jgi:hypothetical protein
MPQCSKASDAPVWKCLADSLSNSLSTLSSGQNTAVSSASGVATTSTSAQAPPACQITTNSQRPSPTPNPSLPNQQHEPPANAEGSSLPRWIIVGFQSNNGSAELEHIAIDGFTNDSSFFRSLRGYHWKHRGFFKIWFSVWRVGACDSVRVCFSPVDSSKKTLINHTSSIEWLPISYFSKTPNCPRTSTNTCTTQKRLQ